MPRRVPASLFALTATPLVVVGLAALVAVAPPAWARGGKADKGRRAPPGEREARTPPSLRLELLDLQAGRAVVLVGGVTRGPGARLFVFHDDRERHFVALDAACEEVPPEAPPTPEPGGAVSPPPSTGAPRAARDPAEPRSTEGSPREARSPEGSPREARSPEGTPREARSPEGTPREPRSTDGSAHEPRPAAAPAEELQRCVLSLPRPYLRAHVTSLTVRLRGREVAADEQAVRALFAAARHDGLARDAPPALPMTSPHAPPHAPALPRATPGAAPGPAAAAPSRADDEELEQPGADDPTSD